MFNWLEFFIFMQEKVAFYCGIFLKAGSMIKIMTENIQHKADHVSLFQK